MATGMTMLRRPTLVVSVPLVDRWGNQRLLSQAWHPSLFGVPGWIREPLS